MCVNSACWWSNRPTLRVTQKYLPPLSNSAARWSVLIILPPDVSDVELSFWNNSRSHTRNMLLS